LSAQIDPLQSIEDVDVEVVQQLMKDHGATVHSVDEVVVVKEIDNLTHGVKRGKIDE